MYRRKSTSDSAGKPKQKLDAASGTIFRISKSFQKASRNFTFVFLFNRLKIKKLSAHVQKVLTLYPSGDPIPLSDTEKCCIAIKIYRSLFFRTGTEVLLRPGGEALDTVRREEGLQNVLHQIRLQ